MTKQSDNSPAFPFFHTWSNPDGSSESHWSDGMELRDFFAANALTGLLSYVSMNDWYNGDFAQANRYARESYRLADAMLRARAAQSPRAVADRHIASWTEGSGK